jgi:hypothetical protein
VSCRNHSTAKLMVTCVHLFKHGGDFVLMANNSNHPDCICPDCARNFQILPPSSFVSICSECFKNLIFPKLNTNQSAKIQAENN